MRIKRSLLICIFAVFVCLGVTRPVSAAISSEAYEALEDDYTAKLNEVVTGLDLDGKSDYDKVYSITEWIKNNVKYEMYENNGTGEKHTEYPHSKVGALLDGYAVCDGYAELFFDMCESVDIEVYSVFGRQGIAGAHEWNIVGIDGEYYYVDPTNVNRSNLKSDDVFLYGSNTAIGWYIPYDWESENVSKVQEYNYNYYHSDCGDNHNFKVSPNSQNPFCTVDGYDIYYCTNSGCYASYKVDYPAPGHHWDEGVVTKEATCTEDGEIVYTCKNCLDWWGYDDTTKTEKIPATGHDWDYDTIIEDNRTCIAFKTSGIVYKCKNCDETKLVVGVIDHDYVLVSDTATCTSAGKKTYWCAHAVPTTYTKGKEFNETWVCGAVNTEVSPAKGHTLTSKVVYETADCIAPRTIQYTCTVCGYKELECFDRDGNKIDNYSNKHTWDEGTVTKEPTCTETGIKTYQCAYCDETKEETIAATDHTWNDGVMTIEQTCTKNGLKEYTCKVCGKTKYEFFAKTGHTTVLKGQTDDYTGDEVCTSCGKTITQGTEVTHTMDSGTVTKAPTCTEEGVKTYTCTDADCDKTVEEIIPATGHGATEVKNKKTATCSVAGYTGDTYCKVCGEKVKDGEDTPMVDHTFNSGKVTTAAGCTTTGVKTYTCSVCGKTKTEGIAATGHVNTEIRNKTEATCKTEGYSGDVYCKTCGTKLTTGSTVAKTAHTYDSGTVTKAATCTAKGVKTFTCTVCGATTTEEIPATGHVNTETRNKVAATCTKEGYSGDVYCKDCGTKISSGSTVAKIAHTWDSGKVTTAATCTAKGTKTFTCTVCGTTKTENIAATGHNWNSKITIAASCLINGSMTSTCSNCGEQKTEEIKATGHTWDSGVVTTKATCTTEGIKTYTCKTCGSTVTESIPVSGHTETVVNKKSATCTTAGYTGDTVCSVCGVEIDAGSTVKALGHSFSNWKVTKAATAISAGVQARTCSRCKKTETKAIAKLAATGTLSITNFPLKVKQTYTVKVNGMAAGDRVVSWASSNTKIATVTNAGLVKGIKKGSATITATLASGKKLSTTVKVQTGAVKTTSVTVNTKNVVLQIGKGYQLAATRAPLTSLQGFKFTSSNKKVATVNGKGYITAKKAGTTRITVKSGSKKAVVVVTVQGVKTTKLTANTATINLKVKKSATWKVTKTPTNSSDGITYTSSNKKVATVNKAGKITAKKKGTAIITAKSGTQTIKVTVVVK